VSAARPSIEPFGDAALLVTLGSAIDEVVNDRAHALARAVEQHRANDPRFARTVPAYASVLIPFDPVDLAVDEAMAIVERLLAETGSAPAAASRTEARIVEIPVRYGGADGPDLETVAGLSGIDPGAVIDLHAGTEYRVYFLGFAPGFAYLGRTPDAIVAPRLATPRGRVAPGSVGLAGRQTAVYPFELPAGWQIIGRTERPMWDVTADEPSLLRPGDRVRFIPR
jgi:inhibitor of KinA